MQIISHVSIHGGRLSFAEPEQRFDEEMFVVPRLNKLIDTCTKPNPSDRPTARELIDFLEELKREVSTKVELMKTKDMSSDGGKMKHSRTGCAESVPPRRLPGRVRLGLEPIPLNLSELT